MFKRIQDAYAMAKEWYATFGVDTDEALDVLAQIPISLHCWQGDDVAGFESSGGELGGGLAVTGNYPGKARDADELRRDLDKVYSLIPGAHRLNLHAIYAETGGRKVERNELQPEHFAAWIDWAKETGHGIDFNPTCFSHPKAESGFALASYDEGIRNPRYNLDSVESKLFGIGSESYVVGSHEFYLGYAIANDVLLCLDSGHFHPTETISDKLSSVLTFLDEVLLHVSRGVRWDSDHVVILSDELQAIAQEIARGDFLHRVHIGLDYFDASINRVAAWVVGARNTMLALLMALLEPIDQLRELEVCGDYTRRLALLEALKGLPFGAVWDTFCAQQNVPLGTRVMDEIQAYENDELSKRT